MFLLMNFSLFIIIGRSPMDKASYINHQLNTSVYRNSCRFSKAERFANLKQTYPSP